MFSYRYFSFLPGLPAASLDISRFRWWNEQLEIMCVQNTDKNIRKICCKIRPDDLRVKDQNSDSDDFENDQYAKELCIF